MEFLGVVAQWGYSEVINCPAASCYDNVNGIIEIRKKRANDVPFEWLTYAERDSLASACYQARPNLFPYLQGIALFDVREIDRPMIDPCLSHQMSGIRRAMAGLYALTNIY